MAIARSRRLGGALIALIALAAAAVLVIAPRAAAPTGPAVAIDESAVRQPVPPDYLGLSVDPANLCHLLALGRSDPAFLPLLRDLAPPGGRETGVLRVGGNTGDKYATWSPAGPASCAWHHLVISRSLVRQFFAFARQIGYRVMWQVPLDNAEPALDAAEAAFVSGLDEPDLQSLEIGNEPNFYTRDPARYGTYIAAWAAVDRDYRADGGTAPVSGPAATISYPRYLEPFAAADAGRLSALTVHWYVNTAKTRPTCASLLAQPGRAEAAAAARLGARYRRPVIVNETNTYTSQGMPGVSDAFCSALWAAAWAGNGLAAGLRGMYFHGTADYPPGNSLGRPQSYTPITAAGTPAPEFYGLLFTAQLIRGGGHLIRSGVTNAPGMSAYAVLGADGDLRVALVNRADAGRMVTIRTQRRWGAASEIRLAAPALTARSGVTLGRAAVSAAGSWAARPQPARVTGATSAVRVPADTAVLVTYTPGPR